MLVLVNTAPTKRRVLVSGRNQSLGLNLLSDPLSDSSCPSYPIFFNSFLTNDGLTSP